MKKGRVISSLREISIEDRKKIVEDYLISGKSKQDIWKKHTGQEQEHGNILNWMRTLGYSEHDRSKRTNSLSMKKLPKDDSFEKLQLQKRISELEQELKEAKLKAIAYSTMVDVAEKEFKLSIRKKYNTKP